MGFRWVVPPSTAFVGMYTEYEWAIIRAILSVLRRRAPEIQNWMKENRPWQDRTGAARSSLTAEVLASVERITIQLTLGRLPDGTILEYGKHLEFSHGGQYAIIGPAIEHWTGVVMADIQALLR